MDTACVARHRVMGDNQAKGYIKKDQKMPAALSIIQREEIVKRREEQQSFAHIAREMRVHYNTVWNVWQRYRQTGSVRPNYAACVHTDIRKDPAIYARAIALKQAHRGWGARLIWVELAEEFAEEDLPNERTLQRWFHRAGLVPGRAKDQREPVAIKRGQAAHETWAMDAKEEMQLADGSYASWLTISDEGSGAILHTDLFPHEEMDAGATAAGQSEYPAGF